MLIAAVGGIVVGSMEFGYSGLNGLCSCWGFCKIYSLPFVAAAASEKDEEEEEENCCWKYCQENLELSFHFCVVLWFFWYWLIGIESFD